MNKELKGIQFGILSREEILDISVCEINNSSLEYEPNSVYDERLGLPLKDCATCLMSNKDCPGHFGHIELADYIIHPLFVDYVVKFLKCFCVKCFRFIMKTDSFDFQPFLACKGEVCFKRIVKHLEKVRECEHCHFPQPKIGVLKDGKNSIYNVYGNKKIIKKVDTIKHIFDNILTSDLKILGFDPSLIHPKHLITNVLLVLPPKSRPQNLADGTLCHDNLTNQYCEIIKKNNSLKLYENADKRQTDYDTMYFKIKSLFNNSSGKAKYSNGKVVKGFKERLSGKGGLIRQNLMGKRTNYSARSVIGAEPTLRMGEVAVPEVVANQLTVPEIVNHYNIEKLQKFVDEGIARFYIYKKSQKRINLKYATYQMGTKLFPGDVVLRRGYAVENATELQVGDRLIRDGMVVENIVYPGKRPFKIAIGDIVERQLMDGDYVLFNRAPTLHIGSIISHKVVIKPYKTFRMNLAVCKSFNSDYDGDEMNIHIVQTLPGKAEMTQLSSIEGNFMSPSGSNANVDIVQDSVVAMYLMTKASVKLSISLFSSIVMWADNFDTNYTIHKLAHIQKVVNELQLPLSYLESGKCIFSLMLPDDFNYQHTNKADLNEPTVKIYKGVLYEGVINKKQLSGNQASIVHCLYKEYSVHTALTFVNNVQFIASQFLYIHGFSIHIGDCICHNQNDIDTIVYKGIIEADDIEKNVLNPDIAEVKIDSVLGKTKDLGQNVVKKYFENNNFATAITSGAKGSIFNITQITSCLGQQSIDGDRIEPRIYGDRTLIHYPFGPLEGLQKYESRGFIANSFIKGLNPKEFFFHAMSGRVGVIDTAMKTATSGYCQRKIIKICEDLSTQYDGTVRNASKKIIQFNYGDNGFDPKETIINSQTQEMEFVNLNRLVTKLNMQCENSNL